jgi:hypothetical protein
MGSGPEDPLRCPEQPASGRTPGTGSSARQLHCIATSSDTSRIASPLDLGSTRAAQECSEAARPPEGCPASPTRLVVPQARPTMV